MSFLVNPAQIPMLTGGTLGKTRVPRLQFWHLTDRYFHTGVPEIILPQQWMVDTRQQAAMHHGEEQVWLI